MKEIKREYPGFNPYKFDSFNTAIHLIDSRYQEYWLYALICSKHGIITGDAYKYGHLLPFDNEGQYYLDKQLIKCFCNKIERNLRSFGFYVPLVFMELKNDNKGIHKRKLTYGWAGILLKTGIGYKYW